ncbi:mitochondrial n-glutamine methyltransferase mtq1 [Niveomyces insectorum RCEF 264]|uniref:Mitochondrial n-glutamine methyltransferase mtq1 n=1 Tax=Niveomyces insectorum RCEF 264 TaxID=1081102 RepID=A0A168AHY8_9HYPO|nr:mitochondrial n-glutamine methyltransferase mtq1 [Niveomyces insectorum RCEF 264]
MPRLPPSLFWRARHRAGPGATLLLPVCRDLPSARTELRWIREHVQQHGSRGAPAGRRRILALCRRRGRGEPLQYVLGTQPFGPLELLCRRGVLIPRPEPEAYTLHLAALLAAEARRRPSISPTRPSSPPPPPPPPTLTVLDACTGSGCIALLLYAQLRAVFSLRVLGLDRAPAAVALARVNARQHGFLPEASDSSSSAVHFVRADFFSDEWLRAFEPGGSMHHADRLDVLVCNPPYVSPAGFARSTARSVRLFEPKAAQVPAVDVDGGYREDGSHLEDVFYGRLLALAARLDARLMLCEVGGLAQAQRVVARALADGDPLCIEIWADCPDAVGLDDSTTQPRSVCVAGRDIPIRGSGHGRSVFIRRR